MRKIRSVFMLMCCCLLLLSAPLVPHGTALHFHQPHTTLASTGAVDVNRTHDLLITNRRLRYQLQQNTTINDNIINMLDKIDVTSQ